MSSTKDAPRRSAQEWLDEWETFLSDQTDGGRNADAYAHGTMQMSPRGWLDCDDTLFIKPRHAIMGIEEHVTRWPGFNATDEFPKGRPILRHEKPEGNPNYNGNFGGHLANLAFYCNDRAAGPLVGGAQFTRWDNLYVRANALGTFAFTIGRGSTRCSSRGLNLTGGSNRHRQGGGLHVNQSIGIYVESPTLHDFVTPIHINRSQSVTIQNAFIEEGGAIRLTNSSNCHIRGLTWREGPQDGVLFDLTGDKGGNTIQGVLRGTSGPFLYVDRAGMVRRLDVKDWINSSTNDGTTFEVRTTWRRRLVRRWKKRIWKMEVTTSNGEEE